MTLFNCFVMGVIEDSLPGILRALSEGAVTLQQGGGIGYDFSTLRPKGSRAKGVGAIASGPVSFMPIFAPSYRRSVLDENGAASEFELTDYSLGRWRRLGNADETLPGAFVTSNGLTVSAHLEMQAALQKHVDNAISKTVNVPEACPFETFRGIYEMSYEKGLKGCTAYRPNPVRGAVLQGGDAAVDAPHCCALERETD